MIAVLTGDIVHSRKIPDKTVWLTRLKAIFGHLKKTLEPEGGSLRWELYRGDSFQSEWTDPKRILYAAMLLRAGLRSLSEFQEHKVDVRIGIGIGQAGFRSEKVQESDGEAYQFSGAMLDELTREGGRLKIKTTWSELNASINASLPLLETLMNDWTQPINEAVYYQLMHPRITQTELAQKLSITQPTVNWRLRKAHLDQLLNYENYFREQIAQRTDAPQP